MILHFLRGEGQAGLIKSVYIWRDNRDDGPDDDDHDDEDGTDNNVTLYFLLPITKQISPHTYYLVYLRLHCLLDGGVRITVHIFQRVNDFPTTFQQLNGNTVQSSTLSYFIQYPTILPNLADLFI